MRFTARFALLVLLCAGAFAVPNRARADDAGAPRVVADAGPSARAKASPSASALAKAPPSASVIPSAAPSSSVPETVEPVPSAEPAPIESAELAPLPPEPQLSKHEAPQPQASATAEEKPEPKAIAPGFPVRFGDDPIFAIRVPRAGRTAEERATGATRLLARAATGAKGSDVKVQRKGDVAIVLVGSTPIIQLVPEDAAAAGDASVDVHAASVAASIRDAIENERKRAAIADSVLKFSLLVFLALAVVYVLQKLGEFAQRARVWLNEHGERVLAVRIRRIDVVSPGTVKVTGLVGLTVGTWIARVAVVYAWVVYALSKFEATRGYTQRLTGLVVTPLSDLLARIAIGLPVLAVLVIAGFAVFVLVRFVGLFFSSVGRRENVVAWIPSDLVPPVSSLVRFGIVVGALLFIAPLITGSTEGVLARSGWVVVLALGLAATPVLANGLVGTMVLFGRRLRAGQYVEIGHYRGRISFIGLLELCLEDDDGAEIRIPHLYTLFRPMRISRAKVSEAPSRAE